MANLTPTSFASPTPPSETWSNRESELAEDETTVSSSITGDRELSTAVPTSTAPSHDSRRILPVSFQPGNWDVVCQRGKDCYHHVGNQRLKLCVDQQVETYLKASSRVGKTEVITSIVRTIQRNAGSGTLGFVVKDPKTKRWYQTSSKVARDKVSNALRDASKTFRRVKEHQQQRQSSDSPQYQHSGNMQKNHVVAGGLVIKSQPGQTWSHSSSVLSSTSSSTIPALVTLTALPSMVNATDDRSLGYNNAIMQKKPNTFAFLESQMSTMRTILTTAWLQQQQQQQQQHQHDDRQSWNASQQQPWKSELASMNALSPLPLSSVWLTSSTSTNHLQRNIATTTDQDILRWGSYDHHVGIDENVLVDLDTSGLEQENQGGIASFFDAPLNDFDF